MKTLATPEAAEAALAAVKAKRGYLLPHHGLLAVAAPEILEAYDRTYTALTLTPRALDERRKEFVWLGVLTAADEAIATHHIKKFRDGGGTDTEIEAAVRLAALARGASAFAFVAGHWQRYLPRYDRAVAYRAGIAGCVRDTGIAPGLAEMAMAAIQTCHRAWWEVAEHIRGAYREGVPEIELAEALSYAMFPGSIPNFVDACGVWRDLVKAGEVPASETLKLWAAIEQGGFDATQGSTP